MYGTIAIVAWAVQPQDENATIATAVGEQSGTIEEVYEPFLIQEGYLMRTPRGRQATEKAYKHLGLNPSSQIGGLFE